MKLQLTRILKNPITLVIIISLITYLLFFHKLFLPNYNFGGSDAKNKHIPARTYLYRSIIEDHKFPFWTERLYSGFPVYADPENGYLHPVNVASILIFGPILSYNFLHLAYYLIGSVSLFLLLRRHRLGITTFTITNLTFYFSFFMLSHNIHYNILMVTFLYPLNLLLANNFLRKPNFKSILSQAVVLSLGILWGQVQFVLLVIFSVFMYLLILGYRKIKLKSFLLYFAVLGSIIFVMTLPLLVPAYSLYKASYRTASVSYTKGTLNPALLSVYIHPFIFGRRDVSFAEQFKYSLSYTETSVYVGIVSIILAISSILLTKKSKLKIFLLSQIFLFFIFSLVGFIPIPERYLFGISMFRYWIRAVFLSNLAIGILAGYLLEKYSKDFDFKNILKNIWFPVVSVAYILGAYYLNVNKYDLELKMKYPYKNLLVQDTKIWLILIGLSVTGLLALYFTRKVKNNYIKILLTVFFITLISFDQLFYAQDLLKNRLRDISDYVQSGQDYAKERIVDKFSKVYGMQHLYFDSWSVFGYSQFVDNDYKQYLKNIHLQGQNYGGSYASESEMAELGTKYIINKDGSKLLRENLESPDFIVQNITGTYVKKEQGHFILELNVETDQTIDTYIRSHPEWILKIDGTEIQPERNDIFLSFNIPSGKHIVEFKFVPKSFYYSLVFSLISLSLIFVLYAKKKDKINSLLA